jgi:DNA-binding LytR/AlgR family response regulator
VRIHRNTLVAVRQMASIDRGNDGQYSVRLREVPDVLQVSRRLASDLLKRFRG